MLQVELFLTVLLLVLLWYFASTKKPSGLPPGLWGWPIIGSLPPSDIALADQVQELRKKHGDIISWRMGSRLFIYLCNYKLIKTVFQKYETVDRPDFYSFGSFNRFSSLGITASNGQIWHNNRKFALRHLKDLGMGKSYLGDAIRQEAGYLVEDFKKYLNHPTPLPWSINGAVLNVIWQMVAGTRYDIDDRKIEQINQWVCDGQRATGGSVVWLDLFPWLTAVLPYWLKTRLGMNDVCLAINKATDFIREEVVIDHIKTFDPDNIRDFIDTYLLEMEQQKDDQQSTLSVEDLCHVVSDLFVAGSMTTSTTIRWTILYLTKYPDTQKKAHKEIDSALPRDVLPSLEHKDSLPYLEAITYEVARLASLVTMGIPHTNNAEFELEGYKIPKNSVLIGHTECCHRDPANWEKPSDFYPEHFLDENGKFSRKNGFLPFSLGRRLCVGESLARAELFIFLAALLQNFTFSAPEGEPLNLEKSPSERFVAFPYPYKVIIKERE